MSTKKQKWKPKETLPTKRGWYITRTEDGDVQWRAFGCGAWWKQIKGGWIEWFTGDGVSMTYEWDANSYQNVNLNSDELPALS